MGARARQATLRLAMVATLITACSGAAQPSPSPSVTPAASPSMEASAPAPPSPAPTAAPTASSTPSLTPAAPPSTATSELFPWLPPVDTSLESAFHPDDLVFVDASQLPVSPEPGAPPYRFDMGEPDPSANPPMSWGVELLLVVLHGPVVVDGVPWYLLTPAQLVIDAPTGWAPAVSPDGGRLLERASYECPTSPIQPGRLAHVSFTDGWPACYGDREITLEGVPSCDRDPDPRVTGPDWLVGPVCSLDAPPSIYGLGTHVPPGRLSMTGHFDDPAARDCRPVDGDTSSSARLNAILECRRAFVATSVTPIDGTGSTSLEVDGTARVVVDDLRVRARPGLDAPAVSGGLGKGSLLFIMEGPVVADGYRWFNVHPFDIGAIGWVAAASRDGTPWLTPGGFSCDTPPLDGGELLELRGLGGLACFGGHDVELVGDVTCTPSDPGLPFAGPSWLRRDLDCRIDVLGESMLLFDGGSRDSVVAAPRVIGATLTGHWDDPEAHSCVWTGPSPGPGPAAVLVDCRSLFVVTEAIVGP